MPAAVLLSPWQTGSHDLRRTYCKTPLAAPEPRKERTGSWGRSQEGAARLLQAEGPTRWYNPTLACGQGGQEEEASSAPAGLETALTVSSSLYTAKKPQLLHSAGPSMLPIHKCILSEASELQGQCSYRTSIQSWDKVLFSSPAGWWPLFSSHLVGSQQVSTHSFPICQSSCTMSLWPHSWAFHPALIIPRKENKAHLSIDCGHVVLSVLLHDNTITRLVQLINWKLVLQFKLSITSFAQKFNFCLIILAAIGIFQHSKYQRTFRGKQKTQHCYCFYML